MSFTVNRKNRGRLCNQIIRNLATSFIAQKHDLFVKYSSHEKIKNLGIDLFCGKNKYTKAIKLSDGNFFNLLNKKDKIKSNINPNNNYFQTKDISNYIYNHFRKEEVKNKKKK